MAQQFILKLTDGTTTVDFLSTHYRVADGGFDIGLPNSRRDLAPLPGGFYRPSVNYYEYREATLKFQIRGETRSEVLSFLHVLQQLLRAVENRSRVTAGHRLELMYAWEGSTDITYFEIYDGQIRFPSDVLSVAKVHYMSEGLYALPDVELKLRLSAYGYGLSIFSSSMDEIPLINPLEATKKTGGITVHQPGNSQYNWVEIDASDVPGDGPLITRVEIYPIGQDWTSWYQLFMGLQQYPYPSRLIYDSADTVSVLGAGASLVTDPNANGGSYYSLTQTSEQIPSLEQLAWEFDNDTSGMFYAFWHTYFPGVPNTWQCAVGCDDYVSYGIRWREEFVVPQSSTVQVLPLGPILLPPTGYGLQEIATLDPNLWIGLWFATPEGTSNASFDYLSFLPMGNGIRTLNCRRTTSSFGKIVDDGWKMLQYTLNDDDEVRNNIYGMMQPLKLEPGIDQRIYFTSIGSSSSYANLRRKYTVRVFGIPTYSMLAM